MTTADLMTDLARLGITLEAHGDRLRYSPRSAVTPDLAQRMKTHKGEVLALLRTNCDMVTDSGAGAVRPDQPIDDPWDSAIDSPEPCPDCTSLELWQAPVGDRWRCLHCDPPTAARRLKGAL